MKKNLSSDGHKLVNTILSYEKNTSKEDNYFPLISTVSVLLENQLSFILAEKLFPYVQDLVEIMKIERGDRYRTGGLEAWHEGKVYLTLGLIIQLINGARWGIRLKKKRIIDFIKNNFFPPYLDIISDKKLAQTLDMIRLRFRNATCHGKQVVFTEKEYNKLLLLSTGYSTLKNWTDSDISLMPPEQGILHNHMILVKN